MNMGSNLASYLTRYSIRSHMINILICGLFLSANISSVIMSPVDCSKFVFAPTCRGVIAKRILDDQSNEYPSLPVRSMSNQENLANWMNPNYVRMMKKLFFTGPSHDETMEWNPIVQQKMNTNKAHMPMESSSSWFSISIWTHRAYTHSFPKTWKAPNREKPLPHENITSQSHFILTSFIFMYLLSSYPL